MTRGGAELQGEELQLQIYFETKRRGDPLLF